MATPWKRRIHLFELTVMGVHIIDVEIGTGRKEST
jgi:hypothetical protein